MREWNWEDYNRNLVHFTKTRLTFSRRGSSSSKAWNGHKWDINFGSHKQYNQNCLFKSKKRVSAKMVIIWWSGIMSWSRKYVNGSSVCKDRLTAWNLALKTTLGVVSSNLCSTLHQEVITSLHYDSQITTDLTTPRMLFSWHIRQPTCKQHRL